MSNFWEKKQISVTGGEGFLGRHLVRTLEKKKPKKKPDFWAGSRSFFLGGKGAVLWRTRLSSSRCGRLCGTRRWPLHCTRAPRWLCGLLPLELRALDRWGGGCRSCARHLRDRRLPQGSRRHSLWPSPMVVHQWAPLPACCSHGTPVSWLSCNFCLSRESV